MAKKEEKESLAVRDLRNSIERREIEIEQLLRQIEHVKKAEAAQAKAQAAAEKANTKEKKEK